MYLRKILFGIVFILLSVNISYSQSGWVWQNPTPTSRSLLKSFFLNPSTGWIVGSGFTILKTTNAGTSWQTKNQSHIYNCKNVFFINNMTGWVIGENKIIYTSDGGDTWNSQISPSGNYENVIAFRDENTGFIGSDLGVLLKTTNSGLNWNIQDIGSAESVYYIKFFDNNNGMLAGRNGTIKRTTNGGVSWINYTTFNGSITTMQFLNESSGWLIDYPVQNLYSTTNAGVNWTLVSFPNFPYDLYFTNYSTGYVSCGGKIYTTTNAGASWTAFTVAADRYRSITFANADTGYTTGEIGNIFRTTNAGISWHNLRNAATTQDLRSTKFVNGLTGFAVGDSGAIVRTSNGGQNWSYSGVTTSTHLISTFFVNPQIGWVCGNTSFFSGALLKTTNGGINWINKSYGGSAASIESVFFLDSSNGFFTGYGAGSVFRKTTNGGVNWIDISFSTNSKLRDIYFVNNQTGWTCGQNMLFKTTNGGNNWVNQISSNANPYSLYFINEQTGWASGGNNILKTINGGTTWSQVASLTSTGIIYEAKFLNSATGYCVLSESFDGHILKTTNGGNNWTSLLSHIEEFYSLDFTDVNTGYVVGKYGAILKTTTGGNVFISQTSTEIPEKFSLYQNYPNPFNPSTNIKFDIHKQGIATLKVFDLLGKEMETLVDEQLSVGTYEVTFNASSLPSGIYFYVLKTGEFIESKKMVLVK